MESLLGVRRGSPLMRSIPNTSEAMRGATTPRRDVERAWGRLPRP